MWHAHAELGPHATPTTPTLSSPMWSEDDRPPFSTAPRSPCSRADTTVSRTRAAKLLLHTTVGRAELTGNRAVTAPSRYQGPGSRHLLYAVGIRSPTKDELAVDRILWAILLFDNNGTELRRRRPRRCRKPRAHTKAAGPIGAGAPFFVSHCLGACRPRRGAPVRMPLLPSRRPGESPSSLPPHAAPPLPCWSAPARAPRTCSALAGCPSTLLQHAQAFFAQQAQAFWPSTPKPAYCFQPNFLSFGPKQGRRARC
jgi:hypothetical protein